MTLAGARPARLLALGVVVALALGGVAYPLHLLLREDATMRSLQAQVVATQQDAARVRAEIARWGEPGYVAEQITARLHDVRPGQVAYTVIGAPAAPARPARVAARPAGTGILRHVDLAGSGTWFARLWGSTGATGGRP